MKWINRLLLISLCVVNTGCGLIDRLLAPSAYYHTSGYYSAGWTLEGKILASKQEYTEEERGSDNPKYGVHSVVEIDPQNPSSDVVIFSENVRNRYKQTNPGYWMGDTVLTGFLSDGKQKWVALQDDENFGLSVYGTLSFYSGDTLEKRQDQTSNGVIIDPLLPTGNFSVYVLCPNKEKNKIVLSAGILDFAIYSADGETLQIKTIGGHAIWKSENKLFFYHRIEKKLAEYDLATGGITLYPVSFLADFFNESENAVYQIDSGYLKKCSLDTFEIQTIKKLAYDPKILIYHSFSPDGKQLLLMNEVGFTSDFRNRSHSIYIYHLDTDVLTKIRG